MPGPRGSPGPQGIKVSVVTLHWILVSLPGGRDLLIVSDIRWFLVNMKEQTFLTLLDLQKENFY